MKDKDKAQGQLMEELKRLRQRVSEMEIADAERKRAEVEVQRQEKRFQAIAENSSDVIILLDNKGAISYESPAMEQLLGLNPRERIGANVFDRLHPDDVLAGTKIFQWFLDNPGGSQRVEMRLKHNDGSWRTVEAAATAVAHDSIVEGMVVNLRDITERNKMEEALRRSEERFRALVESASDVTVVLGSQGNIIYLSPNFEKVWGFKAEGVLGQDLFKNIHPDDILEIGKKFTEIIKNPKTLVRMMIRALYPDGTWHTLDAEARNHLDDPAICGIVVNFHDITELKQAEEALRESEDKYKCLIGNIPEIIFTIDLEGKLTFVSQKTKEILGYESAETINMNILNFVPEEDRQRAIESLQKGMAGEKIAHFQTPLIKKSGERLIFECSFSRVYKDGAVVGAQGTAVDITERKRAEELIKLQRDFAQTLSAVPELKEGLNHCLDVAISASGMDCGGIYIVDDETGSLTLASHAGLSQSFVAVTSYYETDHPSAKLIKAGKPIYVIYQELQVPKDDIRMREGLRAMAIVPFLHEGHVVGCLNIASRKLDEVSRDARDVLDMIAGQIGGAIARMQTRQKLRESEEKYSTFVEQAMDGVHITQDRVLKFVNKRMSELSGYTVEELIGMPTFDLVPPDFVPELKKRFVLREQGTEVPEIFYTKMLCKDGTVKEMENSTKLIQYEGRPAILSITRDVTERKRMEEEMRESEERFRLLSEASEEGIAIHDKGVIVEANHALARMFGYELSEMIGMYAEKLATPESWKVILEHIVTGSDKRYEGIGVRKDGSNFVCALVGKPYRYKGKTLRVSAFTDITERKRMEEALRESEQRYRLLADNASDVIMLMDMNAKPVYFSPSITRLLGYSLEEALAGPMEGRMTPASMEKTVKHFMIGLDREKHELGGSIGQTLELEMIHKNGSIVIVEMMVSFIRDTNGKPTGMMAILRDVTGRKKAEAEIIELSNAFMATLDSVVILDMDGNVRNTNEAARRLYERDDIGVSGLESIVDEDKDKIVAVLQDLVTNGRPVVTQFNIVTRSGRRVPLEASGSIMLDANGKPVGIVVVERDLTERRQAEARQKLAAEILGVLNEPLALPDAISRILTAIKRETGFYAVGIRLRKDDDFPYFVQSGFSEDFLLTENTLVERGPDGSICLDKDGKISLECTCGLVLSGKTDLSNPLFTPGGSAWTNDSLPILDIPLDQDPRHHPRNRCIHAGFQSVALMPIRRGDEIVGLLQLNDRRKECFTPEMIRFYEGIAASIGVALMRKQAEDALRESEKKMRSLSENSPDVIMIIDRQGKLLFINRTTTRTIEEALGTCSYDYISPEYRQAYAEAAEQVFRTGSPVKIETRGLGQGKRMSWYEARFVPLQSEGEEQTLMLIATDITERKKAEEALRESEERLRVTLEVTQIGVWEWNVKDDTWYASPTYYTMLGYEPVIGPSDRKVWLKRGHPDDVEMVTNKIKDVLNGVKDSYSYEARIKHADGSYKWNRVIGHTIEADAEGKPIRLAGVRVDITERKRAEEALRESEIKYRQLFEHTLLGMEVIDAETGKIVLANHSMAMMFEFKSPEEMVGIDSIKEHVLPEDMDWALDQFAQSMADPDRKEVATIRARTVNGRVIWVTGSATSFEYEGKPAALMSLIEVTAAKEAEEALIRINKAVESSSDAIGISDAQGHHFYHNQAFTDLFEYTAEELEAAGGGPAAFANKHIARKLFDTIKGGGSWIGEVEMVSKSGRQFTVLERADAIKDESGKVIGLVGVHTDITERKRAEEKLRETRDYMENLIEHANVPMVVWTPDFRITRFNRAFERLTGMKAKSVIGKDLEILFPKGTRERSMSYMRTAMKGARWEVVEIPIANLEGEVKTVLWNISPIYAEDGKTPMAIIAQGQDITERKQVEEALRESEEMARSMLDNAAMGIYLLQNKKFLYVNPTFEKIMGYTSAELVGQEAINYVHPDDRDMVRTKAVENIKGTSVLPYEFRALRKDGRQIWVMERVTPIRYKGKRAVIASFMETTEHRKAEVELERAYEELKTAHDRMVQSEKLRAMGEMASGIAHDFNNMLAVILGRTQLVIDDVRDDKVKKGIQVIEQAALDAAKTVKRLQDFARIRVEHPFEPLELNEVVEGVLKMVESRRVELEQTKGITIKVEQELGKVGQVSGDAAELREALLNILFNALDAMPTGGKLTVKSEQDEDWVQISIRDTGVGIPDKVKSKVFEPFFTTKASKGSGLGLSVTYSIIARHGGMIKFDSAVGKGTTFYIRLPLAVEDLKKEAGKRKVVAAKPANILIVDDEIEVLKALGMTLEYFGHWVKDYTIGAEAIKAFKKGKYDIVITDLGMPEVSGWDVARAIKKMKPDVPVLLITGWVIDLDEEQKKLVDGVISKPFSRDSISSAISAVFPAKKKRARKKKSE